MVRRVFTRRGSANSSVVGTEQCVSDKAKAVLQLVMRKVPPLTLKQLDYCDEACIGRFLKARGNNVKKAAKQLRATLSWRANLDVDYLTADEFSAELATGVAFVAGHDDDGKPVLVVRMKPEHLTAQAQKQFVRYFVFTMEVAVACMPSTSVEQCVLIFDTGCLRKGGASAGLSLIIQLLKLLGDHYPERVATIFIVDAPSVFHYLWKGIGAVLDVGVLKEKARFVFSRNYTDGIKAPATLIRTPRSSIAAMSAASAAEPGDDKNRCGPQVCGANKNLTTNSTALSPTPNSNCKSRTTPPALQQQQPSSKLASSNANSSSFRVYSSFFSSSAALLSDKASARSFSFASRWPSINLTTPRPLKQQQPLSSQQLDMEQGELDQEPAAQAADADQKSKKSNRSIRKGSILEFRSFRADTRSSRLEADQGSSRRWADIAPALFSNSSIFNSNSYLGASNRITPPDQLLVQDTHLHDIHLLNSYSAAANYDPHHITLRSSFPHQNMMKSLDLFRPYYHAFLRPPYSEATFRARMKPPLAGLISIISPDLKCHSFSLAAAEAQSMELDILHRLTFD